MRNIAFVLATVTAVALTSCSGNKNTQNNNSEKAIQTETTQEQQIKLGMKAHLDSLTLAFLRLKPTSVSYNARNGKIVLSEQQKKVRPDYLMNPDEIMNSLESISLKYRALAIFDIDKSISDAYNMKDVYTEPISKLVVELDDPAVKYLKNVEENVTYQERIDKVYHIAEDNGRANYFWETAAASIIEELYIIGHNQEVFLAGFTDKDAEDITLHVSILVNAYKELAEYNTELAKLYNVILPLQAINAISVDQLRDQLNQIEKDVTKARKELFL